MNVVSDHLLFKSGSGEDEEGDHRIKYYMVPEGGDVTIIAK